ncbi:DUF3108 domain-containing protein [Anaerophaga thermohalophila]|uniref:DUF3108 domain-containing protein n=1 Tax=Anaerophaga thermohalophila TaxID=177400 RepID=UPI000237C6A3|nr:DUF3108 domain-containing protein [Anaerophaga thermohalophila]
MKYFENAFALSHRLLLSFLFLLVFFCRGAAFQAEGQCYANRKVFAPGEEVTYHAYYNWGFIWINAGIVTFGVEKDIWEGKPTWHMKAYGSTYKAYDLLFKVRDSFEVWVDPHSLQPLEFHRKTNEGSYKAHFHYLFDQDERVVRASISKRERPYRDTTFTWPECSYDLLSMVYQARNIDFSKYEINEKIPIKLIVDGEVYDLYIRYRGKEVIKDRSGRKFRCLKFSPLLVEGTIFEEGEDMTVWVTDDDSRIPIIVEAKILVGSVKAVFVEAKGLKHPMSAEIGD